MMRIRFVLIIILALGSSRSHSQLSDLARIDYTILPAGNSSIEYNRIRALFNYPIKLKKEDAYLFLGLDYSNIQVIIDENSSFNEDELNDFQLLDLNIGYTQPLKNDWRLGIRATPGLSSNLTADDLSIKDIVISGDVVFIKDKTKNTTTKPWRLIVGASYSGNRGFPFPLPFISYYRKFREKWSYNLGIPKTNIQYRVSEIHRLKLFVQLDGFTSNLQQGVVINNQEIAESINMSIVVGGLQYEWHIIDHVEFYARAAYILSNRVELRDGSRDQLRELDNDNSLYLRTGVRLKI